MNQPKCEESDIAAIKKLTSYPKPLKRLERGLGSIIGAKPPTSGGARRGLGGLTA